MEKKKEKIMENNCEQIHPKCCISLDGKTTKTHQIMPDEKLVLYDESKNIVFVSSHNDNIFVGKSVAFCHRKK